MEWNKLYVLESETLYLSPVLPFNQLFAFRQVTVSLRLKFLICNLVIIIPTS